MQPKTPMKRTEASNCKEKEEGGQPSRNTSKVQRCLDYMGAPVPKMLREISLDNLIFPSQSPLPNSPDTGYRYGLRSNVAKTFSVEGTSGSNQRRLCSNKANTVSAGRGDSDNLLSWHRSYKAKTSSAGRDKALLVPEKDEIGVENNKLVKSKKANLRPKVVKEMPITPKPMTPDLADEKKPYRRKRKPKMSGKNIPESSDTPGAEDTLEMTIAQLKYQSRISCRRALKFDCENMTMDQPKHSNVKADSLHITDDQSAQVAAEEDTNFLSCRRGLADTLVVPCENARTRNSPLTYLSECLYGHEKREEIGVSEIILMENDGREEAEENVIDINQEKQDLDVETQLLLERVESFMSTMRLIQGSRQFSKWKGSVIDSVAGAFLAQNARDNHSSSAFMCLAAKYPIEKNSPSDRTRSKTVVNRSKSPTTKKRKFGPSKTYKDIDRKKGQKTGKGKACEVKDENKVDWERVRRSSTKANEASEDALDWYAVNYAELSEVSDAIECRGMNNKLASRIKKCLRRIKEEHGSLDLEWLRDIPHQRAKEFLLSIRGLGTKSVECIRLLTLQHAAFPVDIIVSRIAVRLGWVPLEPLPEGVLLHNLKRYPMMNSVHKYLSERLCLEQKKLYELHIQMITFGKVFCTKINPNCNACPLRGECKHFASEYASAKFGLSGQQKNLAAGIPAPPRGKDSAMVTRDIEDTPLPIEFNSEAFMKNVWNYIQENHITVRDDELAEALADLISKGVFLPEKTKKVKAHQRTQHIV